MARIHLSILVLTTLLLVAVRPALGVEASAHAADERQIRELAQEWQEAWNRRDAAGLAAIMDPQVTFVSVLGPDTPGYGRGGRTAFQKGHEAILKTAFADSV